MPVLNPNCFGLPLLQARALNGAIPTNDRYETNFHRSRVAEHLPAAVAKARRHFHREDHATDRTYIDTQAMF